MNEVTKDNICKITEARLGSYDGRFGLRYSLPESHSHASMSHPASPSA